MNKTYKLARGYFRDYQPAGTHTDMVFFALDKRVIYLNGVSMDGNGLVVNVDEFKATEAEIIAEQPTEKKVYLCTENHTVYEWTENNWHRKELGEGGFANVAKYGSNSDVLVYWDGSKLVNANVKGVGGYVLEKVNDLYYWFEG